MPKVLQIDSCLGIGSTGRIAEGIATAARKSGWDTYMAHGARYIGKTEQIPIMVGSKLDEYQHKLNSLILDNHGLNSRLATKKLINRIVEIDPDIIHLHCIHGYYINYEILLSFLAEYSHPVVWTQHDCWAFTGHCAHFEKIKCQKWKTGCKNCELKHAYPKTICLDRSSRNWNLKKKLISNIKDLTIVSVSKWLDSIVHESFLGDKSSRVIYNGIDRNIFQHRESTLRDEFQLQNRLILVGVATSWSEAKGLNDYAELSKVLDPQYKIVLIGLNESQRNKIPSSILGLPRTNNTIELAQWYSAADIVLNLSYQETFGLTTVEGLACGTPGIVYNSTASPELITPQTGIIVEPGNIDAIIDAISTITRSPEIFNTQCCVDHVKNNFDGNQLYKKYIELYNELLNIH